MCDITDLPKLGGGGGQTPRLPPLLHLVRSTCSTPNNSYGSGVCCHWSYFHWYLYLLQHTNYSFTENLVLRPSLASRFWSLTVYAKTQGRPAFNHMWWHQVDGRQSVDRSGAVPLITHKLCVDQPRVYWATNCIDTVFWILWFWVLVQDITGRVLRFFVGCHPLFVTSPYTWLNLPPPFLHTASNWNWTVGRPGNEAKFA